MNSFFICFLVVLLCGNEIHTFSEEYYECLNPDKTVYSHYDCTLIKIPDSEGYKCCSTKLSYEQKTSYNCFPLENKYATNQELLNDYISKRSIAFLFGKTGGNIEVECPNEVKMTEKYEKISDEYLTCYNNHMKGVDNENDCQKIDIPTKEGRKCCFLESLKKNKEGKMIDDKRCYIIQDEYFTNDKNFSTYLIDESNIKSLDQIMDTNITIKCKNYDTFFFQGTITENDDNDKNNSGKSKLKAWAIVLIILGCLIVVGGIGIVLFIYIKKKKKIDSNK